MTKLWLSYFLYILPVFLYSDKTVAHTPESNIAKKFEFIENKGQWNNPSLFSVQLNRAQLFIEKNALQYFFYNKDDVAALVQHPRPFKDNYKPHTVKAHALRIAFLNSSEDVKTFKKQPFKHYYNYFLGNNPSLWKTEVKPYAEVTLKHLYNGIDATFYTQPQTGALKYDIIVHPEANVANIKMQYEGANKLQIKSGALYAETSVLSYIELKPYAYQVINGQEIAIKCAFKLNGAVVSFDIGDYDKTQTLIIDPEVVFSTYSGSTVDNFGHTATYDNDGNFYTAGIVTGPYPTFNPNGKYPATSGAFQQTFNGGVGQWPQSGFPCDIAISKYNNDGTALLYATYLGGDHNEYPHSIVVDKQNQLIVFGSTHSSNFPVTTNAYDVSFNSSLDESDIFVTKLNANGTNLIGSTFIGGSSWDGIMLADSLRMNYADEFRGEVQVNAFNEIIVATTTLSSNFPVTTGAFQTTYKGKQEACIFKLDSLLKQLKWSSFLGQSSEDAAYSLDIDSAGNIYVAGGTQSHNFPVTTGVYRPNYAGGSVDGFISKISADGSTLLRSMLWGGKQYDQTYFVKLDSKGKVNVLGQNYDSMPVTSAVYSNAKGSLYISRFSKELDALEFSTVIGNGTQNNALSPSAFIVDACGNIYASCWGGGTNNAGNQGGLFTFKSTTEGLPVTADALQKTTDKSDFYLFVLKQDAKSLFYASFLGGNLSSDHVDGGTSRFDKRGVIYQSNCSSCHNSFSELSDFPTTAGSYSPKNKSPRCSNASYKLDFRLSDVVIADFKAAPVNTCSDTNVTFTNNSFQAKQYYWFIDGVFKDTTKNYAYTFPSRGTHQVKLVAVDSSRCIIIDSITKTINVSSSSNSQFAFTRDSCSFKVSFINQTTVAHSDTIPFLWQFGDGDTSSQKNPIHNYQKGGNYTAVLISNPGTLCADTSQTTFHLDTTIYILEARFDAVPLQSCLPSVVSFKNESVNGRAFYWYYDTVLKDSAQQFVDSFNIEKTIAVKLVVMDSVSCKKTDSITKTVVTLATSNSAFLVVPDTCGRTFSFINQSTSYNNIPISYLWFFGDGDSSIQKDPTHKYFTNDSFSIKLITNPGTFCADTSVQKIKYDSNAYFINAKFYTKPFGCSPQWLFCQNETISDAQKFYWYLNGVLRDSTVNYFTDTLKAINLYKIKLVAIDTNTCNQKDSVIHTVFINASSTSAFDLIRDTCSPLVTFINKSTSYQNEPVNYLWDFGDGTFSTDSNPPPHLYPNNKTYAIKLISGYLTPCADTSKITFIYDSLSHVLLADFSLNDSIFCAPTSFRAKNESSSGKLFFWYINDVFKDTSRDLRDTINSQGTITIKLIVVDSSTCNKIDTVVKTINVGLGSIPDFNISRDSCSLDVVFNNLTGTSGIPYMWYFGDGDSSNEANPKHQYSQTDHYTITLISQPGSVCSDTLVKTFFIDGDTIKEVQIPNVFTPNGDGINDFFEIRGVSPKCDEFHIWIYNRWENLFFESTNPTFSWNGKNEKGVEASEGVYFYVIDIKKRSGLHIYNRGTITLIMDGVDH